MKPNIRYARSGGVSIAYQVVGDGPTDLVMVFGYVSNIEVNWEEPMLERDELIPNRKGDSQEGREVIQDAGWAGGQHGWLDPIRWTFVSG